MKRFSGRAPFAALIGFALLLTGLFAAPVFAQSLVRGEEDTTVVTADQVVDGAAFLAGNNVDVRGTIKGDLFCAGNTISISGTVEGDVLCAGNTLTISGTVKGDVRAAGNVLTVSGIVGGAATMAGNSITIATNAKVGTDLTVAGSQLRLAGDVGRDVKFGAENAVLEAVVGREVQAGVNILAVEKTAKVGGALNYTSSNEATIADGAVLGSVNRTDVTRDDTRDVVIAPAVVAMGVFFGVIAFVILSLFVALVVPRYVHRVTDITFKQLAISGLFGLGAVMASLLVIIIAFVSGVGFSVGFLLIAAYVLAGILAGPLVAYYLGRRIMGTSGRQKLLVMLVGAVTLAIVSIIPLIGFIATFVALCIGIGMILRGFSVEYEGRAYRIEQVEPVVTPTEKKIAHSSKKK